MTRPVETWRAVPGYEGRYSVSDLGRVRSEARMHATYGGRQYPVPARILKCQTKAGYHAVELFANGKGSWRGVHTLVAEAFIGPRPHGMFVCHEDGTRANNKPSNLRYDTPSGNQEDRARHGTMTAQFGESNAQAKLTAASVAAIRADSRPKRHVARDYGISESQVRKILTGECWPAHSARSA